jgi:predicted DNA-binding ribbon-helix-helix protein
MNDPDNANPNETPTGLVRVGRVLTINGRTVTVRLEPAAWQAFDEVCQRQGRTADELGAVIDRQRGKAALALSIRDFLTRYFREAADRDRPQRGLAEAEGESPALSPLLSRALDSIGPPRKR